VGRILPPKSALVQAIQFSARTETVADDAGRVTVTCHRHLSAGPVRLEVTSSAGRLITRWITR
jgi:hypothetical protein